MCEPERQKAHDKRHRESDSSAIDQSMLVVDHLGPVILPLIALFLAHLALDVKLASISQDLQINA